MRSLTGRISLGRLVFGLVFIANPRVIDRGWIENSEGREPAWPRRHDWVMRDCRAGGGAALFVLAVLYVIKTITASG